MLDICTAWDYGLRSLPKVQDYPISSFFNLRISCRIYSGSMGVWKGDRAAQRLLLQNHAAGILPEQELILPLVLYILCHHEPLSRQGHESVGGAVFYLPHLHSGRCCSDGSGIPWQKAPYPYFKTRTTDLIDNLSLAQVRERKL